MYIILAIFVLGMLIVQLGLERYSMTHSRIEVVFDIRRLGVFWYCKVSYSNVHERTRCVSAT